MRFMVLVKASKESEAGVLPSKEMIESMGKFNDELIRAGVLLAADGLQASAKGARIKFGNGKPTVTDGPFAETKELLAGYWVVEMRSKEETIEWFSRCPMLNGDEIEVRQVFEASDFPAEIMDPESASHEQAWRDSQKQKT